MDYKLDIRHLAAIEVIEAYDWYELQSEGLGSEFLIELDSFYDNLLQIRLHIRTTTNLSGKVQLTDFHTPLFTK